MTPQSTFLVLAPVRRGQIVPLRDLLASMNRQPGMADPENRLFPFGRFDRLHVARFVVLDDDTLDDLGAYGASFPDARVYLAFLGDCDGPGDAQLLEFAAWASHGLRRIFAHCEGFDDPPDLGAWLLARNLSPTAQYTNWPGRTVRQIQEEAALHHALRAHLQEQNSHLSGQSPGVIRERLRALVRQSGLRLTLEQATPVGWQVRQLAHLIGGTLFLLLLLPVAVIGGVPYLIVLRRRETRDPVVAPRPSADHVAALAAREDHDVTNSFSAFGSMKPGLFRLATLRFALWLVNYGARHIYTRGRLARVGTIHFARWVLVDGNRRLLFASNYDGSLDSYMDDFINKVAYGLNLVFSNGVGYPHTDFLLLGGAKDEQNFKRYLRRHQRPTDVWYKAYPGLTAYDLANNARIREGLERETMTESETRQWLALI